MGVREKGFQSVFLVYCTDYSMNIIITLIDFVLHIDVHLGQLIATYGVITYAILFVIIFIETGLVLTPFLPGDSLLFAAGAFSALGSLNIFFLTPLSSLQQLQETRQIIGSVIFSENR